MKNFTLGTLFVAVLFASALSVTLAQDKSQTQPATTRPAAPQQDEGQKVFEQNCSRCHNAPEGFSPRISASIVRHMRVRANLSREDEQKLLRFFNP